MSASVPKASSEHPHMAEPELTATVSDTRSKRKYVRLPASTWAEIRAHWELGEVTLAELSENYGVSPRALQTHFAKHHTVKGAKAEHVAAAVREKIFKDELDQPDLLAGRAKQTRETAYKNSVIIEQLIMGLVDAAQNDPSIAIKAATAIKGLAIASAAIERLHSLKLRALGLDKGGIEPDELPVLEFRDLSAKELEEIKRGHDEDDATGTLAEHVDLAPSDDPYDDDDIVDTTRTGSAKESAEDSVTTVEGYRLVREAIG